MTTRQERINASLLSFEPTFIEVLDESHRHHVPKDAQTHFKVTLVSKRFDGLSRLKRHQLINEALIAEFEQGMHALSLHLYTPAQWAKKTSSPNSPACQDGYDQEENG